MEKFSIIIPVYNVEQYLERCLNSIVNQTLGDFEVICVDDGSTDNSLEILMHFAEIDQRFIILPQENRGQGVARNNALGFAEGEYIVFVDPDDWLEENALEELYYTFQATKAEVIEFDYCEYNDNSGELNYRNHARTIKKNYGYDLNRTPYYSWKDLKDGCLHRLDMHVWTKAYSNKFIEKIGAVFSPTKHGEDHLFANIVLINASKIYYLDKYLYTYRCRKDSAVNKFSNDNFCIFHNIKLLKDYLVTHNFYEELKEEFKSYKVAVMAWHYRNIPTENLEQYKGMCQQYLTPKEYKKMLYKAKWCTSFFETIFSLKNERRLGIKRKVVTIFGIKIKIKPKFRQIRKIAK